MPILAIFDVIQKNGNTFAGALNIIIFDFLSAPTKMKQSYGRPWWAVRRKEGKKG